MATVRAGLGVSILPASAQRFHDDNVQFRHLSDVVAQAEMSMAWWADQDNPAVTAFRLLAVEHFESKRLCASPGPMVLHSDSYSQSVTNWRFPLPILQGQKKRRATLAVRLRRV